MLKARVCVAVIVLCLALVPAGCRPGAPGAPTLTPPPRPSPSAISLAPAPPPPRPSPSATSLDLSPARPAPQAAAWTRFLGVNEVHGLAFASAAVLWAATGGGVVRWDLDTGRYTRYGPDDGLPADYVNGIALAPDGSPWVATPGGVSHYDGTAWTTYTRRDGLADDGAVAVAVTPAGVVWAGTTNGVSRFDGRAWTSYQPGTRTWSLAVAPDGDLWLANDDAGVGRYSPAADTWTAYGAAHGLPAAGAKTVGVGPDGDAWVYIGYDHVYRFDGQTWRQAYDAGGQWVCGLAFAGPTPWIATCGGYHAYGRGLAVGQESGWARVTAEQGLPADDVQSLAVGPGGLIAAGTDRGLAVRQAGAWRVLRAGPLLNDMSAVAVTPDGAAWFGFGRDGMPPAAGGVSRLDGQGWQYEIETAGVQVLAVEPARGGAPARLWAGAGCSVLRRDGPGWQTVGGCDQVGGNVLDLAFEPGGAVWAATGLGLARYDGGRWTAYDRLAHAVEVAADGTVWIAGWEGTLGSDYVARLDGAGWEKVWAGRLGLLAALPDGTLWGTAGEQGLARLDGRTWTFYADAAGLPLAAASALAADPAAPGALWVAAGQALARLDGETWSVYSLPANGTEAPVEALAVGPDGALWLATARGALCFRPDRE